MSHVRASLGERFAHHKQLDDEKKEEAGWCFGFYFFSSGALIYIPWDLTFFFFCCYR